MARGPACLRRTPHLSRDAFPSKRNPPRSKTLSRTYQPACKPGSVGHRRAHRATIRDGHSSGTMFAHGLEQPTRTASLTRAPAALSPLGERPALPSLFGLAPGGVYHAGSVAGAAVRSCRTFSPLLAPFLSPSPQAEEGRLGEAVRSLWHFPWGCPRRMLSGTACRWSPDFPPRRPFDTCRSGRPAD